MKTLKIEDLDQLVICECGLVWNLSNMKQYQYDGDRRFQRAVCKCGATLYDERDGE